MAEYEAIALALARDPQRLATLKAQLEANRKHHPLFDANAYCRSVEAAYETMWTRHQGGKQPEAFSVTLQQ